MAILTLAEWHSLTGITDTTMDARVTANIPFIQNLIETYLDRTLDTTNYAEWLDYDYQVTLPQYPVTSCPFVGYPEDVAEFTPDTYSYEFQDGKILITDPAFNTTTVVVADSTLLSAVKTAVEAAVPAVTMTIATGKTSVPYRIVMRSMGTTMMAATKITTPYRISENRTVSFDEEICFSTRNGVKLLFVYTAGYLSTAAIPKAIKMVAASMITDLYGIWTDAAAGIVSRNIKSETIGDHSTTFVSAADGVETGLKIGAILEPYEGELWPFRKKVI